MSVQTLKLPSIKSPSNASLRLDKMIANLNNLQKDLHTYKLGTLNSIGSLDSLNPLFSQQNKVSSNFNRSMTYKLGKNRIRKIINQDEEDKRKQKENNILSVLNDDNPDSKKYMTPDMFVDKETYRILKNNKRKFGVTQDKNKHNFQYFETPKAHYKFKRGRDKRLTTQAVAKSLNSIFFNFAYRNSPRVMKNKLQKQVDDGDLVSGMNTHHYVSHTECASPIAEINTQRYDANNDKPLNKKEIIEVIMTAIQRSTIETSTMKNKFNRLMLMRPAIATSKRKNYE